MALKTMGFYDTDATQLAISSIRSIAIEHNLTAYTFGLDVETEDVLVFFPCEYLNKMKNQETFLTEAKKAWEAVGFVVKEQTVLKGYHYLTVSFPAVFFRLGC